MTSWRLLIEIDRQASARLAIPREARALRWLAFVVAHSGDSPLWLTVAIAACLWGNAFWRGFGGRVLIGTLAAGAIITALKWLFRRRRPLGNSLGFYMHLDHYAFPSGHAGRSACLVVLLAPLLPPWAVALLTTWAGLVGLARIALEVHFVSDVIGGWIVGSLTGLALHAAL